VGRNRKHERRERKRRCAPGAEYAVLLQSRMFPFDNTKLSVGLRRREATLACAAFVVDSTFY